MAHFHSTRFGFLARCLPIAVTAATLCVGAPAAALEELKHEKKAISACEINLCRMLVTKETKGPDLKCDLTKTWGQKTIKEAESSSLTWGFGDARCTVKIDVKRAEILNAINAGKAKFHLPDQKIDCIVEESADGKDAKHVVVVVSPKIEFKDGKAEKIWVNLKSADGPGGVTGTLKLAAFLADKLGLFHGAMLKGVNGFIYKSCPKVLAKADADAKEKKPKAPKKKPISEKPPGEKTPPASEPPVAAVAPTEPPPEKAAAEPPAAEKPAAPPATEPMQPPAPAQAAPDAPK